LVVSVFSISWLGVSLTSGWAISSFFISSFGSSTTSLVSIFFSSTIVSLTSSFTASLIGSGLSFLFLASMALSE
jgi:hypothetical protein